MNKMDILNQLKKLKPIYEKEGLILLGLFGSYAKDTADENSDIDLLYKIEPEKFTKQNRGFTGFTRILNIKDELKELFNKEIDLCSISGNSRTFKKFALKDAIHV